MATAKDTQPSKLTAAQLKKKVEDLEAKLQTIKEGAWCYLCDTHKARDKFYVSTDPLNQSGITPICKECAKKLALSIGKDKVEHEPTKESVRLALRYLNKPFLENVWDASVAPDRSLSYRYYCFHDKRNRKDLEAPLFSDYILCSQYVLIYSPLPPQTICGCVYRRHILWHFP